MNTSQQRHRPVMLEPILEALALRPEGRWVDATLGEAGFTEKMLELTAPGGDVLALDWDEEALELSAPRLAPFGGRVTVEQQSFANLDNVLEARGWGDGVDGIIVDLGVSTRQLVSAERGFSFQNDGPLDMRMDRREPETAADLVNTADEKELADLIYKYGEERASRRIARQLVERRVNNPFKTTNDLRVAVRAAGVRGRPGHDPATRTFQALRIAVNNELAALEALLDEGWKLLRPGGRLLILSYHSLEDRLVKNAMRDWAASCHCPVRHPVCTCGWTAKVKLLWRRKVTAGPEEVASNPRSRSAGLRGVERLPLDGAEA
jgi:16S rRNA (cytosine1402-N4)-methyltransferase